MVKVKVYTTEYCPYCRNAKDLLKDRGIAFEEIVVDRDDETQWQDMIKKSGMRTVPQIWAGDRLIGGYQELAALDRMDKLASIK